MRRRGTWLCDRDSAFSRWDERRSLQGRAAVSASLDMLLFEARRGFPGTRRAGMASGRPVLLWDPSSTSSQQAARTPYLSVVCDHPSYYCIVVFVFLTE